MNDALIDRKNVERLAQEFHDCDELPITLLSLSDRIEELEAENKKLRLEVYHANDVADVSIDKAKELEAKLAKVVEALQWLKVEIRGHGFSDEGRMLTMCISTLAELTGGKDE